MCSVRGKNKIVGAKSLVFHHNTAHNALSIQQLLAEDNNAFLEQSPYSPDWAPCDYFPVFLAQGSH